MLDSGRDRAPEPARILGYAMTPQPSTLRTTPRARNGTVPGPAVLRWAMILAVLAGFVAMHGLTSDHGVHTLAGSAAHHSPVAPAVVSPDAPDASVDLAGSTTVSLPSAPGLARWTGAGETGAGHADIGCMLMLSASVLALVLAAMGRRRSGLGLRMPFSRVLHVVAARWPPRRTAPGLFVLGVLRT